MALYRAKVPAVLALVHSTFGHPGVARTVLLARNVPLAYTSRRRARVCALVGLKEKEKEE